MSDEDALVKMDLHDLKNDAMRQKNVIKKNRERGPKMRAAYLSWLKPAGAPGA